MYDIDLSNNQLSGFIPGFVDPNGRLDTIKLNNNSLTGPIPHMEKENQRWGLEECDVQHNAGLCSQPHISSLCNVGLEECNMDCVLMNEWEPKMFDFAECCQDEGVTCVNERIATLYVLFKANLLEILAILTFHTRFRQILEILTFSHGLTFRTTASSERYQNLSEVSQFSRI
jgi:hypothetical protein